LKTKNSIPDLQTPMLWEAIRTKDLTTAWKVLLGGTNPNVREETHGFTPLHVVCLDGNVALAMLLFTKDADVNARDNSGQTPMHKACMCGHMQIVTFLLKAKANSEILDNSNRSPEELAIQHGHLPIFRLLVGIKTGDNRSSLLTEVSTTTAKAMRKEQEKRERNRKKLKQKEQKLTELDEEIQEKMVNLTENKNQLMAIPEQQQSKKEKQNLVQISGKLAKLQLQIEKNAEKIRTIRGSNFEEHPTDKGQAWIDYVKQE